MKKSQKQMKIGTPFLMLAVIAPLIAVTTTQVSVPNALAQDENITMEEATNAFIAQDNETMEEATNVLLANMTTGNMTTGNMTN